jgi:hypothetical protein
LNSAWEARNDVAFGRNQVDLFRATRLLLEENRGEQALDLLGDILRRGLLYVDAVERAGRMSRNHLVGRANDGKTLMRVLFLGQFTTSSLIPSSTAVAAIDPPAPFAACEGKPR